MRRTRYTRLGMAAIIAGPLVAASMAVPASGAPAPVTPKPVVKGLITP